MDATAALLTGSVAALEGLAHVARRLHPPQLGECVAAVDGMAAPLAAALDAFELLSLPPQLENFGAALVRSGRESLAALQALGASPTANDPILAAYRALRGEARALEALYPLAAMLPPVSRFFLSADRRDDTQLIARYDRAPTQPHTGIRHAANPPDRRGGFSVYVPEILAADDPAPLAVVLHGGSGHGRGFLYTWLADARARGIVLLSPTSVDRTWNFESPDVDHAAILRAITAIEETQQIDRSRVLLSGMSDGGTFCWLSGLATEGAPFTHIAPVAASFHPMLVEGLLPERVRSVPIHLVHGALDWMFPVDFARGAHDTLAAHGANITYREVDDLSHTWPRELTAPMLDWFLTR